MNASARIRVLTAILVGAIVVVAVLASASLSAGFWFLGLFLLVFLAGGIVTGLRYHREGRSS